MRITTTTALLSSLLTMGCARIGGDMGDDTGTRPDAGTLDQNCDEPAVKTGDMTLSDTTSFKSLPGGCWSLSGSLTISGSATTLEKLGDLRSVKNLTINGSNITELDTPSTLTVTGTLDIENASKLTSLANLKLPDDATCLSGKLDGITISGNQALTDLGGVRNVMCVAGPVVIQNNVELGLIRFDTASRFEGGLKISQNNKLTGITMPMLSSITGDLEISNNSILSSFTSLAKLQFIHGSIIVDSNPMLTTLPTEMKLDTTGHAPIVETSLTITNNAKLTELGGFTQFMGVNFSINVTNNATLDYCEAREVGCCVGHSGTAQISTGNKNHTCGTQHASCWAANGNTCRGAYTN